MIIGSVPTSALAQRQSDRGHAAIAEGERRFQYTQARPLPERGGGSGGYRAPPARPMMIQGREVSDQDHEIKRRQQGEIMPMENLLRSAQRAGRGEYLGVEPNISSNRYRFKFMRPGSNVVWVDVDARTGQVVSVRE